jgi:hypothetical protein
MDPATRLKRHSQLWEAGNTSVRRTALSGVIFSTVILLRVILPNAEIEEGERTLTALQQEERVVQKRLAEAQAIEPKLNEIAGVVDAAPWNKQKDELIRLFASGPVDDPQAAADRTVRSIAKQIRRDVVSPLRAAIDEVGVTGELAGFPDEVEGAIGTWETSKLGRRWFRTIREKEGTVHELGDFLEDLQEQALNGVREIQTTVHSERSQLQERRAELGSDIEKVKAEIEQALEESLPAWAKELVTVDAMAILYPWILLGIAAYLVGTALSAARHYRGMADVEGWSAEERSDPLLSSTWTLTWRGAFATTVTLACYSAVLLCLWYCLYRSLDAPPASVAPLWLPHGLMALALITVLVTPLRRRPGTQI